MKHPQEMDLHDLDKIRIDELEQQVLVLTYDLEHAQDRLAECECEAERVKALCPYGCQEE